MSPLSRADQPEALRGGVPVLFPQFGTFGPLAKHGFARTAPWQVVPVGAEPGRASVALELVDSEATRAIWPHPFHLHLAVHASERELHLRLVVTNRGEVPAAFTGGLHTYLAVSDPDAWIDGLTGGLAWDGASVDAPRFTEPLPARVPALAAADRVIAGVTGPVVLQDAVLGALELAAEGFPHRVVWNPGPGHGLPDVAPGDESRFVCIEAVAVTPVTILPGGAWQGTERLRLLR
jgi:glucose-6-phosphate 1-epimerase